MKTLTVEWANVNWIYKYDRAANGEVCTQVVRLSAVDAVLAEAVWAMEIIKAVFVVHGDECQLRAQAFLSSQVVTEWRERQEWKL